MSKRELKPPVIPKELVLVGDARSILEESAEQEYEIVNRLFENILNIPVRQHRKSGRRETVCPGLRKLLMRVYSRNVLSKP